MKKNISINISGIIFHIEEDGYEILKKYLDSINKYFSTFEDSSEILSDIESRIAELFLGKLNEGKQVITTEDVKSLITTMGNVSDFKAAEEQQDFAQADTKKEEPKSSYSQEQAKSGTYTAPQPKRFMRDQKRKVLGGVCAGLGNYFNIDPVWIRLLFAFLTLAYGIILIAYLILWIVIPGSYDLEEPQITRKLFRDPERKVLGGVSSGLASYFGIDVTVIRVLFVVLIFAGGIGLITYIVLWIVLPEARSITDKVQMQGEPVTLSNIESSLKKGLDVKEGEENAFVKILLFPFRLLGWLLTGLGKILTPLMEVLRVGIGIFLTLVGLSLVVSVLFAGGVLLGFFTFKSGWMLGWEDISFPMEAFSRTIPTFTVAMGFIACLIPGVIIVLLGVSAIAKRIVFSAPVGWTLFIAFFISAGILSATIPKIALGFKEDGEYKVETTYELQGKTAVLKIRETGLDDYDVTSLSLKGYEGKEIKLVQYFEAQGRTRLEASDNAKMVDYQVVQEDSVFTFDSNISFKEDAVFKAQRLDMSLYIPYNYPFVLDDNMWRLLSQYIDYEKRDLNTWVITNEGWLKCTTCEDERNGTSSITPSDLQFFRELEVSGLINVTITQGNTYSVELNGQDDEKEKYSVYQNGETLVIEYDDADRFTFRNNPLKMEKMEINIIMPELERLEVKGAGDVEFSGFTEDDLEIKLLGAVKVEGNVNVRKLSITLNGASELILSGQGESMEAQIQGASGLNAFDYKVRDAFVDASGASKAKVNVTGRLEIDEGVASDIEYIGNPNEVIKE